MPSESLVARFLGWRWAPSVLLVTGALAFAFAAPTLIPESTRLPSPRSPSPGSREHRSHGPLPTAARRAVLDPTDVRDPTDALDPTVDGLFPSTPAFELPPPLEEPEPPPEPAPALVPTEMSVPGNLSPALDSVD